MIVKQTERGFDRVEFTDANGLDACVMQSSAIRDDRKDNPGSSCLWLGLERREAHLNRQMVAELIPLLQRWLETGLLREQT